MDKGNKFIGLFKEGKPWNGTIFDKDKETGKLVVYPLGGKYIGGFKNGKYHGEGFLSAPNDFITYRGSFRDGHPNGVGKMKFSDGIMKFNIQNSDSDELR